MLVFTYKSLFWTIWPQKNSRTFPGFFQNFSKIPGLSKTLFKFQDFPGISRAGGNHVWVSLTRETGASTSVSSVIIENKR